MNDNKYLKIRVMPKSKKELVTKVDFETYNICVREPAERNLANTRVMQILAKEFGVGGGAVQIINGHRSPNKIISIKLKND